MTFVPKITKPDLTLQNVTATTDTGALVDITKLKLARKIKKNDRTPGSSKTERVVLGKQSLMVEVEGFNGGHLSVNDITPGGAITSFTLEDNATTPESVLWEDTLTLWPLPWYWGDTSTELGAEPSKWQTEILPNVDGVD